MGLMSLILLVMRASIMLNVFAVGLGATVADAVFLFRRPRDLGRALLSMNVVMPVCASMLASMFGLHPAVKIALVALSVSPVPPIFPKKALKTGGGNDYSIGLLVAVSLFAVVVVPGSLEAFEVVFRIPLAMSLPSVAGLVSTTILVPLFAGIGLRVLAPPAARKAARPVGLAASLLLALSVIPVFVVLARTVPPLIGNGTLSGMACFAFLGLAAGHALAGPQPGRRPVLALATASRHPGMAVAIAQANFPEEKLVVTAVALYLAVSAILFVLYRTWAGRGRGPRAGEPEDQRAG